MSQWLDYDSAIQLAFQHFAPSLFVGAIESHILLDAATVAAVPYHVFEVLLF